MTVQEKTLHIDIPVKPTEVKIVFSIASLSFEGDLPASIFHLQLITNDISDWKAKSEVVVVFHTNAGHVALHDQAYNPDRNIATGNPYKKLVTDLMERGVHVELCGATAKAQRGSVKQMRCTVLSNSRMINMNRFRATAILGTLQVLAAIKPGMAQTQESAAALTSGTPNDSAAIEPSASQDQSAAELGKQASNPLSSGWLMQTQQNNSWVGIPLNHGDRVQSDLLFQPLVNFKLTDNWTLFARPILTFVNSTPYVDASGQDHRTTAFGDMVLAFAIAPHPLLGSHLLLAAGPTFIFPTATENLIGQHTWQLGPNVGAVWLGKHFIAYAFPQQWFKVGGTGPKTNQLSALLDFTYFFKSGWNIGTEPNILVNWQARSGQRLTL